MKTIRVNKNGQRNLSDLQFVVRGSDWATITVGGAMWTRWLPLKSGYERGRFIYSTPLGGAPAYRTQRECLEAIVDMLAE